MKPVILFRSDYTTEDEFDIASKYFDVIRFRSDAKDNLVIGRHSTLPFYTELVKDLQASGSVLINSYEQYNWIANFDWYHDLKQYTFETWFDAVSLPEDCQFVVKGRTNSRKHNWDSMMHAKTKQDAIRIMLALNEDSLIAPQGIIFRRFEKLVTYEIGLKGLPFTNEWRFFFYKGQLISHAYYWTLAQNIPTTISEQGMEFALKVAAEVAKFSNFYVLDIAEKESGGWVLVEINDGQMAGLSENDADAFYKKLREVIENERSNPSLTGR